MRRSATLIGISAIAVFGSACSSASNGQPHAADAHRETKPVGASPASSVDAGPAVQAAVDAAKKSTARIDDRIRVTGVGQDFTTTVKGAFDMKADKGRLKVSLAKTGTSTDGAVPLDEIFDGSTVYFRMPEEANGDTDWLSTSRNKVEVHALLRAPLNDPEHVLRQVTMRHDYTEVGKEKVNGTPAVHYAGKLNHKPLLLRLVRELREKVEAPMVKVGDRLPATADVWVTKGGQITRIILACDLGSIKVTATMNLTDHGKPLGAVSLPKGALAVPAASVGGPLVG